MRAAGERVGYAATCLALSLLVVAATAACTATGDASHQTGSPHPAGSPQETVTSVATVRRNPTPVYAIELRRVVLRTSSRTVVATFTTFDAIKPIWLKPPECGQVGIGFQQQDLDLLSSRLRTYEGDSQAVNQDNVTVRLLNSHTIRLSVPRAALGEGFSATEPWLGFAVGYGCPPLNGGLSQTDVVTPTA